MFHKTSLRPARRRGSAVVEFAMVAPVFLIIVVGVSETSRMFEMQNQLASAAREGARMAVMDRAGISGSTNQKLAADVQNFLTATGIDPADVNVQIVSHEDPSQTFNLDDPANNLKLFEVRVTVPFGSGQSHVPPGVDSINLTGKVVFRNGKLPAAQ
jgi:Flp pilus assembly protein TadG